MSPVSSRSVMSSPRPSIASPVRPARIAGARLRTTEREHQLAAPARRGGRLHLVGLERLAVEVRRLFVGHDAERPVGGGGRVLDRAVQLLRLEEVARELLEMRLPVVAAELLDHLRDPPVEPYPAGHAELLVERVADERVREA